MVKMMDDDPSGNLIRNLFRTIVVSVFVTYTDICGVDLVLALENGDAVTHICGPRRGDDGD